MPELPEVETIARNLRADVCGRQVRAVSVLWPRTIAEPSPEAFVPRLTGQSILGVSRRAKYLIFSLSRDTLLIHLRMSGDLQWRAPGEPPQKHDRLWLSLYADGEERVLAFHDPRKFGRVWLVEQADRVLGDLGPEPLEEAFTAQMLFERLQASHRQIKALLLDQRFLAGLGNIYSDEALHRAGIHPLRFASDLSEREATHLWQAIRDVLEEGIRRNGASIDWVYRGGEFQNYFQVYARQGEACYRCGQPIQRLRIAQRSSYFCAGCQK
ncbi:MAG: bifunctional DNA-formamidopyrimidine glycosylase/DNA-(apurinic or apyrimidinic site) lyase [Anaerolineales bacterium]